MATIEKGILGGLSGKVGTVIGGQLEGKKHFPWGSLFVTTNQLLWLPEKMRKLFI